MWRRREKGLLWSLKAAGQVMAGSLQREMMTFLYGSERFHAVQSFCADETDSCCLLSLHARDSVSEGRGNGIARRLFSGCEVGVRKLAAALAGHSVSPGGMMTRRVVARSSRETFDKARPVRLPPMSRLNMYVSSSPKALPVERG